MKNYYFKGDTKNGLKLINALISKGGINKDNYKGNNVNYYYYIDFQDNVIKGIPIVSLPSLFLENMGIELVIKNPIEKHFQKGDIIFNTKDNLLGIFKQTHENNISLFLVITPSTRLITSFTRFDNLNDWIPATEDQMDFLYKILELNHFEWDPKNFNLDYKKNYYYYYPDPTNFGEDLFQPSYRKFRNDYLDNQLKNRNWIFDSLKDCQKKCNELNYKLESAF